MSQQSLPLLESWVPLTCQTIRKYFDAGCCSLLLNFVDDGNEQTTLTIITALPGCRIYTDAHSVPVHLMLSDR